MPDGSLPGAAGDTLATPVEPPIPRFAGAATVLAGHLRRALEAVRLTVATRNTIPILAHVHLTVADGVLTAIGTDMEARVTATAPAEGRLPAITADARGLTRLVAALPPDAELRFQPDPGLGALRVKGPGVTARLLAFPVLDFPGDNVTVAPDAKGAARFDLPVPALRALFGLPFHAISTEETRYYLNGIYLEVPKDAPHLLRAVATDGHRLTYAILDRPHGAEGMAGVIIPRLTAKILRALLGAVPDGTVRCAVTDTRVMFSFSGWTVASKLIDGTFPDYMRVIPKQDAAAATIEVLAPERLRRLSRMATTLSQERSRPVRINRGTGTAILLSHRSPEGGDAEVSVPEEVALWHGPQPPHGLGFQGRYFDALLKALPGPITFQALPGGAPMRADFPGGVAVLMPMRV